MSYELKDFSTLQQKLLLDEGSLWRMLKKDLEQMIEMPSYFDPITRPGLGTGLNLSLMMVAVGGLEAMATLADIDGLPTGANGTDIVQRFMDRYFTKVNSLYVRPKGQSLATLIWDAYRNGGLHKYFPKKDEITVAGGSVSVEFGITWPVPPPPDPQRCLSFEETRVRWATTPEPGGPIRKHLSIEVHSPTSVNFWVCAPYFTLELLEAVAKWMAELAADAKMQQWFVNGVTRLEKGLTLHYPTGAQACLTSMVVAALEVQGPRGCRLTPGLISVT